MYFASTRKMFEKKFKDEIKKLLNFECHDF